MNKIGMVLLAALFIFTLPLLSGEEPEFSPYRHALGFQGGRLSGTGLTYQMWDGPWGYQAAAGGLYLPVTDSWWGSFILDYSVGVELQRRVYGEDFTSWLAGQLYLFTGINHRGYIPVDWVYSEDGDTYNSTIGSFTPVFAGGIGIGTEIVLFRRLSFPLELGYAVFWSPTVGPLPDQFEVNLIVQGAVRYRY